MSSSVSGGAVNGATADFSSVSGGGAFNVASGVAASVSGGSKGRLPAITTRRWSPVRQGDGHKKTGRNIDRACGHLRGQDFKRRQTRGLTGRSTAFPVSQSSQAQGCSISSRVMDWHITALDLGVRQKRGSKPNYLGNRASLIAFSICGTASGQNRFATSRSIAASATLHKTATVSGSIFTPFFNLKYTGEASLARFSRDSYCSVENSISGFTTGLYNTIG
jgi:hypothetical protein